MKTETTHRNTTESRCLSIDDIVSAEGNNRVESIYLFNSVFDCKDDKAMDVWMQQKDEVPTYIFHDMNRIVKEKDLKVYKNCSFFQVMVTESAGAHNSKLMLIFHKSRGMRVVVTTAVMKDICINAMTQGVWTSP